MRETRETVRLDVYRRRRYETRQTANGLQSGKGPEMVGGRHSITDEGFGDNDDHP